MFGFAKRWALKGVKRAVNTQAGKGALSAILPDSVEVAVIKTRSLIENVESYVDKYDDADDEAYALVREARDVKDAWRKVL